MRKLLHGCLLGLLLLALPVQGWAAVVMPACAMAHPSGMGVDPHGGHHGGHHPDHRDPGLHHLQAEPDAASAHPSAHAQPQPDRTGLDLPGALDCSLCAACCMASAAPLATVTDRVLVWHPSPHAGHAAGVPSHLTSGPDRPPRTPAT